MKTKKPIYFFKRKNKSCKKTAEFLNEHTIPFVEFDEENMFSKKEFLHILHLSSEGFKTVLQKGKQEQQFQKEISLHYQKPFPTITTMETIAFLLENPGFLKTPLVWSDYEVRTTSAEDGLQCFIPNQNRYKKREEIVYS